MRRVVVTGGAGFFGRALIHELAAVNVPAVAAGRRRGELRLDVEDAASLRVALRRDDVVVDTVGPYRRRTSTLLRVALEVGCDLIDLSHDLGYQRTVDALDAQVRAAGRTVLTGCSVVSAVAAAAVRHLSAEPVRVNALLWPAARETATATTVRDLLRSVGRPIETWRDGAPARERGWLRHRAFAAVSRRGGLIESALSATIPAAWPAVRDVAMWVDTNVLAGDLALRAAALAPPVRASLERAASLSAAVAHVMGSLDGGFAVEVVDANGETRSAAFSATRGSFRLALIPAALAARDLANDAYAARGIVPAADQVSFERIADGAERAGLAVRVERRVNGRSERPV